MIREATVDDLGELVGLLKRAHAATPYASVRPEPAFVVALLNEVLHRPDRLALVAEHEGRLKGVLIGTTERFWFSSQRFATDVLIYSELPGAGMRMARTFVRWARAQPEVCRILMTFAMPADRRAERFYERLGLKRTGGFYVGEA